MEQTLIFRTQLESVCNILHAQEFVQRGMTPLHFALEIGFFCDLIGIERLLDGGADCNLQDNVRAACTLIVC